MNKSLSLLFDENKVKQSLEYAIKMIDYANELDSDYYKSKGFYIMAANYESISDYQSAEKNYKESLRYAKRNGDSLLTAYIYNGLGNISVYLTENKETGIDYYNKSLALGSKFEKYNQHPATINLAWSYLDLNKFDKAYPYLVKSEELLSKVKREDINANCEIQFLKARYFLGKNEYEKVYKHFDEALKIAKTNKLPRLAKTIHETRAKMYDNLGDYRKAYKDILAVQKLNLELKADLIEVTRMNFIIDGYKKELEDIKKEKEYQAILNKNSKLINLISGIGFLCMLGAFIFLYFSFRSNKKLTAVLKEKNEELLLSKSKAEKLTEVKSQFISTVSHELRTPLYGVVGITTLLLEDKDITSKHEKLLKSLKFSGDYLLDLINKVLKIGKIESKNEKLAKTPTNLRLLSENLLHSFEYQAKNKNNELILQIPDELPDILNVDSLKISEVLINLIGNSSKFTENGKIWLRIKILSIDKEFITIRYEVEDDGVGIPEDKKEFVFEKFSQIGREFNKSEGTGLGLSIVKNLLKMMESDIFLDNKEGRGTRFYFDLQLEIIDEKDNEDISSTNNPINSVYKKILVAEDNKINQIVTKNLLHLIGYDCVIVENGFNALQMVKKEEFDLVLMDLNMPYLNGMESTRRIREFDQETPIIALTASELSEVETECMSVGMNDIINKPLNKNDLKTILAKHLV
ncbi:response regulator [Aquimarina sp. 2201CG1-2-11]|uniref:tetratricopeptide repeat-containing hybrid sensor histidine kinase/response regulator n=1 Tax=Aquimarina discodermiae TaxID=3231043 RepID=UPI003461E3F5